MIPMKKVKRWSPRWRWWRRRRRRLGNTQRLFDRIFGSCSTRDAANQLILVAQIFTIYLYVLQSIVTSSLHSFIRVILLIERIPTNTCFLVCSFAQDVQFWNRIIMDKRKVLIKLEYDFLIKNLHKLTVIISNLGTELNSDCKNYINALTIEVGWIFSTVH